MTPSGLQSSAAHARCSDKEPRRRDNKPARATPRRHPGQRRLGRKSGTALHRFVPASGLGGSRGSIAALPRWSDTIIRIVAIRDNNVAPRNFCSVKVKLRVSRIDGRPTLSAEGNMMKATTRIQTRRAALLLTICAGLLWHGPVMQATGPKGDDRSRQTVAGVVTPFG